MIHGYRRTDGHGLARTAMVGSLLLFGACGGGDAAGPDRDGATVTVSGPSTARQGEVTRFTATAPSGGAATWFVAPAAAGVILPDGRFVGHEPGPAQIIASVDGDADTIDIAISARGVEGAFTTVGHTTLPLRFASDLWVHGSVAYMGTLSNNTAQGVVDGNALHAWDISDPADPVLTSTVLVEATRTNDVKVSEDGALGVVTHEASADGLNGVTLLDLTDPLQPVVITRITEELEAGVHNAWIEDGFLYLATDGASAPSRGLKIFDVSDPSAPVLVSDFYGGSGFLHDVYVRNGLAFLSHWDVGLVILDVGNGVAGGSPTAPALVSTTELGGNTHNAWYWPETGYVFVGEEDFARPGVMHVVDASDLTAPVEVGTYSVPGITPHNFWMDEGRGVLYAAWYGSGLHAIDVTGELLGDLELQGRLIANSVYNGAGCSSIGPDCTMTWAPQLHDGLIYVTDMGSGLWVLDITF